MAFFKCKLSENWIQFEITDDIADMKLFEIDFSNFKLFCKLISESIDELTHRGIKYIRQMVLYDEYNQFLKAKTTWKIIHHDTIMGTVLIECDINEFINNFAEANGIKLE